MTDSPNKTLTRGDELRADAASEIEDAQNFLADAQRLTDVSTDYRVAALRSRWAARRFENAATLLSLAEDADQADYDRAHEQGDYYRDLVRDAKARYHEAVDGGEPGWYTSKLYDEYTTALRREQA